MRIDAHPLVVAAALGFLGPAALADDDFGDAEGQMAGVWTRMSTTANTAVAATAGARLEIIPVEDRLVVDAGSEGASMWERLDDDRAELRLEQDSAHIVRTLRIQSDNLIVNTRVCHDGTCVEFDERYDRTA